MGSRSKLQIILSKNKGLSFFEVMVTISVLSIGVVMVTKALLVSLDYQNHLTNRLYASNLATHRTAFVQRKFTEKGALPYAESGKKFKAILNNREISFTVFFNISPVEEAGNVFKMDLNIVWQEHGRSFRIIRTSYLEGASARNDV